MPTCIHHSHQQLQPLDTVLDLCQQVGAILLKNGAETSRIEETVERIGKAAGYTVSCYSTLTAIFIAVPHTTKVSLIKPVLSGFNLQKIDQINQLSRAFEQGTLSFADLNKQVQLVTNKDAIFPLAWRLFSAGLVSVAPMLLFQASWGDLGLSFFVGMLGYFFYALVSQKHSLPYLEEFVGGFVIGLLAYLLVDLHLGDSSYHIIVSSLMPLVPGIALTNAIREIMTRQFISGLVRLTHAIFQSGAIGFGVILASELVTV